jgi:hypothetical protein
MYIKVILKDRKGNKHEVKVKNNSKISVPTSKFNLIKFAFSTNKLLFNFYCKLRKFNPKEFKIEKIETDNPLIAQQIAKTLPNMKVEFYPSDPDKIEQVIK